MEATTGDRLHVHSNAVGTQDRIAVIVEVRGEHGAPPYRVRFPDGHETLVYPAHGVGVIEGIQTRVVSGSERKFYMLRILDSDMTIMIPTENVNAVIV